MSQQVLMKDLLKVKKAKMFFDDCRVVSSFEREDMTLFKIYLLPKSGFFRNCLVRFKLKFEDYPKKVPGPTCQTKVFHPNISSSGSICYSMFGSDFKPEFRLMDYINGLIFLLCKPNPNDPLNSECVEEDEDKYDDYVQNGAKAYTIGSQVYEYCHVSHDIKDSKEFEKMLEPLLFFLDQKKKTDGLERKIEHMEDRVLRLESGKGEDENGKHEKYVRYMDCVEKLKFLYNKLAKIGSFEAFDKFNQEEFESCKTKCERYFDVVNSLYKMELEQIDYFWRRVKGMNFDHDGEGSGAKKKEQVIQAFQQAFPQFDEKYKTAWDLLDSVFLSVTSSNNDQKKKEDEEEEEEGEEVEVGKEQEPKKEEEEQKNINEQLELISPLKIFLDKLNRVFEIERRILTHKKRIYSRKTVPREVIESHFEPHDFKILDLLVNGLYIHINTDKNCGKLDALLKVVSKVRGFSSVLFELEEKCHLGRKILVEYRTTANCTDEDEKRIISESTELSDLLSQLGKAGEQLGKLHLQIDDKVNVDQEKEENKEIIKSLRTDFSSVLEKLEKLKEAVAKEKERVRKEREIAESERKRVMRREEREKEERRRKEELEKARVKRLEKRMKMLRKRRQKMKKGGFKDSLSMLESMFRN